LLSHLRWLGARLLDRIDEAAYAARRGSLGPRGPRQFDSDIGDDRAGTRSEHDDPVDEMACLANIVSHEQDDACLLRAQRDQLLVCIQLYS
jgi:hypothetical protein